MATVRGPALLPCLQPTAAPLQDYLPLTRCLEDLGHLKSTWDTIAAVLQVFADW